MSGSDSPTFFHGQPWSNWIERIGRDKPLSDDETEIQPSSSVTRLSVEDIDLYGFCPERDIFYGVVCEICNAIVKPQALIQHMESRHPSGTSNFPTPSTPLVKPTVKTPYCKVSKLRKTQSSPQIPTSGSGSSNNTNAKVNHTTLNKRTSEQTTSSCLSGSSPRSPLESIQDTRQPLNSTGSGTVGVNSPVKSPGTNSTNQQAQQQHRRKRLKADRSLLKDREYDPDRHCGVWNEETAKPCTRSLTCKAHTVSLRRTVMGRSKTFDKLLAEHRAAKELPGRPLVPTPTKLSVTGTVTLQSTSSSLNSLAPSTPVSSVEPEAPSSPPVLSLPDTYPLPKAVDLLYRCLAPHGSTKPTKLEEDFDASEELRSLESSLVASTTTTGLEGSSEETPAMAPITVALPSLSPVPSGVEESPSPVATLVPATTAIAPIVSPTAISSVSSISSPVVQPTTTALPVTCSQTVPAAILESEISSLDLDTEPVGNIYSPVCKDSGKAAQLVGQIPRANNHVHLKSYHHQVQAASMPSLSIFEPVEQLEQLEQQHAGQINGKRLNHATTHVASISRQIKRNKQDYQQEYSTEIQVEATTTSTPYPQFNEISWSNCHPEPLAVSRWLRLTSNRKQYNFNIH